MVKGEKDGQPFHKLNHVYVQASAKSCLETDTYSTIKQGRGF